MAESNQVGRVTLTKLQLRATEIVLYRMADLVNRLFADEGIVYTKIAVPADQIPQQGGQ